MLWKIRPFRLPGYFVILMMLYGKHALFCEKSFVCGCYQGMMIQICNLHLKENLLMFTVAEKVKLLFFVFVIKEKMNSGYY